MDKLRLAMTNDKVLILKQVDGRSSIIHMNHSADAVHSESVEVDIVCKGKEKKMNFAL